MKLFPNLSRLLEEEVILTFFSVLSSCGHFVQQSGRTNNLDR